jgi:hypothetical protein
MTAIWLVVAVLFVCTVALKAVGPVTFGARELSPRAAAVVGLVAPALLAALVVVETVGAPEGGALELDARIIGVAAAGGGLAVGLSTLPVVALAAAVTALARLV